MPNHVRNILKMEGVTNLPLFTVDENEKRFDFNKIIPMPLSLDVASGTLEDIAIEAVIRKIAETKCSFERPKARAIMSDAEYMQRLENQGMSEIALCGLGLQYITNKVKYGATTWYDWRREHWGTKWNSYENSVIDANTIAFETAWLFPEPVIIQLSKMYPDLGVEVWWADEDMGSNTGHAVYVNGNLVHGGEFKNGSNEAYGAYINCWGESKCLAQDDHGNWYHRDCDSCHLCD